MKQLVEIRIYDQDMMRKGTIDDAFSLLWKRKYNDVGSFELHAPINEKNVSLLKQDMLVAYPGSLEAGIIEQLELKENSTSKEIIAKGRFLESYLDRRLIRSTYNYSGTSEKAMKNLVNYVTPIPKMTIAPVVGYTQDVTFQATMKSLLEIEKKIAASSNLGFRCRPDFANKTIVFEVYEGIDRTNAQTITNRVTFSKEYENMNSADYVYNSQLCKTVAVVGGEGEGASRVYVEVGSGTGLNLREVFIDAKTVKSEGLTAQQYKDVLAQKGKEALEKYCLSTSLTAETLPDVNFEYMKDYDVGDIVTIQKADWNIKSFQRITEIQETYEYPNVKISPVFGSPLPEAVKWED